MKQKFLLIAVALLSCVGVANADKAYIYNKETGAGEQQELDDVTINISDVTVMKGGFGYAELVVNVTSERSCYGFQIEWDNAEMPEGVVITEDVDPSKALAEACPGMVFSTNPGRADSDGKTRTCVMSNDQTEYVPMPLGPSYGEQKLVKIWFKADENTPNGDYEINLCHLELASSGVALQFSGGRQPLSGIDYGLTGEKKFTIHVVDYETKVLDEKSEEEVLRSIEPEPVIVKRTLKGGAWQTICLPFDVNAALFNALFGGQRNSDLATVNDISFDSESNKITFNFTNITKAKNKTMTANVPYLIYVPNDITEFSTLSATAANQKVTVKLGDMTSETIFYDDDFNEYPVTFTGVLNPQKIPAGSLFLSNVQEGGTWKPKFYYSTGNSDIKGFRAYFALDPYIQNLIEGTGATNIAVTIDDEPTAIEGLTTDNFVSNDDVYSVSGIYMGKAKDMKKLPKGMYIVNNKKVILK